MNTKKYFELQLHIKASWPKDNIHFSSTEEKLPGREKSICSKGADKEEHLKTWLLSTGLYPVHGLPGALFCYNSYNANLCTFIHISLHLVRIRALYRKLPPLAKQIQYTNNSLKAAKYNQMVIIAYMAKAKLISTVGSSKDLRLEVALLFWHFYRKWRNSMLNL